MIKYQASIIQEYAERLYRQAEATLVNCVIGGTLLAAVSGYVLGALLGTGPKVLTVVITAVVGGVVGYAIGTEKGFRLRLEAQNALCQMMIERNTRELSASYRNRGGSREVYADHLGRSSSRTSS